MGLIDTDKIINRLDAVTKDGGENIKVFSINDIKHLLNNEPTAYDVDKVVEKLEAYSNADGAERLGTMPVVELADAIKIVKGGGVNG